MAVFRPGNLEITEHAVKVSKFPENARILDIGCGEGETMEFLGAQYGFSVTGIDTNAEVIRKTKQNKDGLDIRFGDGEFLDEFTSNLFDGVFMECVLSLINLPDEALHEAYCVLKKGGKLVISDLYIKEPDEALVKALDIEAQRMASRAHSQGQCSDDCSEEHKERVVNFRMKGRFLEKPLIKQLEELGYKILLWEDRSKELAEFLAEQLLAGQPLEKHFCGKGDCSGMGKDTGYFMLIAEKPL